MPWTLEPVPPQLQRQVHPYVGLVRWRGLEILVENPKGSVREGDGWSTKLQAHYGEVVGTFGLDGDPVDVYLGPDPGAPEVYVVRQKLPEEEHVDELKVMVGYRSPEAAATAFERHYDQPGFFHSLVPFRAEAFVEHLSTWTAPGVMAKGTIAVDWLELAEQLGLFGKKGPTKQVEVKAHTRRTKSGKIAVVEQHQTTVHVVDPDPKEAEAARLRADVARLFPAAEILPNEPVEGFAGSMVTFRFRHLVWQVRYNEAHGFLPVWKIAHGDRKGEWQAVGKPRLDVAHVAEAVRAWYAGNPRTLKDPPSPEDWIAGVRNRAAASEAEYRKAVEKEVYEAISGPSAELSAAVVKFRAKENIFETLLRNQREGKPESPEEAANLRAALDTWNALPPKLQREAQVHWNTGGTMGRSPIDKWSGDEVAKRMLADTFARMVVHTERLTIARSEARNIEEERIRGTDAGRKPELDLLQGMFEDRLAFYDQTARDAGTSTTPDALREDSNALRAWDDVIATVEKLGTHKAFRGWAKGYAKEPRPANIDADVLDRIQKGLTDDFGRGQQFALAYGKADRDGRPEDLKQQDLDATLAWARTYRASSAEAVKAGQCHEQIADLLTGGFKAKNPGEWVMLGIEDLRRHVDATLRPTAYPRKTFNTWSREVTRAEGRLEVGEPGEHWGSAFNGEEATNPVANGLALVLGNGHLRAPHRNMEEVPVASVNEADESWTPTGGAGPGRADKMRELAVARAVYAQNELKRWPHDKHSAVWRGMEIPATVIAKLRQSVAEGRNPELKLTGCTAFSFDEEVSVHYAGSEWTRSKASDQHGTKTQPVRVRLKRDADLDRTIGMVHDNTSRTRAGSGPFEVLTALKQIRVVKVEPDPKVKGGILVHAEGVYA